LAARIEEETGNRKNRSQQSKSAIRKVTIAIQVDIHNRIEPQGGPAMEEELLILKKLPLHYASIPLHESPAGSKSPLGNEKGSSTTLQISAGRREETERKEGGSSARLPARHSHARGQEEGRKKLEGEAPIPEDPHSHRWRTSGTASGVALECRRTGFKSYLRNWVEKSLQQDWTGYGFISAQPASVALEEGQQGNRGAEEGPILIELNKKQRRGRGGSLARK